MSVANLIHARVQTFGQASIASRLALYSAVLLLLLTVGILTSLSVGPVAIPVREVVSIVLSPLGIPLSSYDPTHQAVLMHLRLPRILVGAMVGMALGASGATMQGVFRNPLADPGVIGVSAGGALGAVVALALGADRLSPLALPLCAFAGALAAALLVYSLAWLGGRPTPATLLLAGVAISSFFGAVLSFILMALSPYSDALRGALFWLLGGLEGRGWSHARLASPFILGAVVGLLALSRDLNLLTLGDDHARALGVRVGLVRTVLLALASLATGVAVAVSGGIAFVGLVVPHILRLLIGADNRVLLPMSALGGALFLVAADTLARTVVSPAEVRVGGNSPGGGAFLSLSPGALTTERTNTIEERGSNDPPQSPFLPPVSTGPNRLRPLGRCPNAHGSDSAHADHYPYSHTRSSPHPDTQPLGTGAGHRGPRQSRLAPGSGGPQWTCAYPRQTP
ncbi:Hemin transport system permease protein HmuU [bacterium HR23]|nr:Hemin transport system permease protein HmuU [bacterium HR23]